MNSRRGDGPGAGYSVSILGVGCWAPPHPVRVAGGDQVSVGRGELTPAPDPPPQGEPVTRGVLATLVTFRTTQWAPTLLERKTILECPVGEARGAQLVLKSFEMKWAPHQ